MTQGGHDDWRRPLCRGSADDLVISLHLDPRPAEHPRDPPEEATGHGTASLARHRAGFDVVATHYIIAMKAVTVRELKNRLSAYLREVAAGEVVLVTERGRVVAELRRSSAEALRSPAEQALERLVAAGVLTIGLPQDPSSYRRTGVRNRTFESDPARRRASRPMTLYAGTPPAVRGGRLGTSFIGCSVMRPRSSARG